MLRSRLIVMGVVIASSVGGWGARSAEEPAKGPEVVKPTVQLRNGQTRGSGTVIMSVPGETLILTAAHVVKDAAKIEVELHRHNLGYKVNTLTEGGGWPRLVPGKVVASDRGTDVAVVRVKGMVALPFVAKLDMKAEEPAKGDVMTSVGIDRALHLTRWQTTVQGPSTIDIKQGGKPAVFTITTRAPEHGRSGGGLFRDDGAVVGVCTGQLGSNKGDPKVGMFASMASIRRLLEENGIEVVAGAKGAGPP